MVWKQVEQLQGGGEQQHLAAEGWTTAGRGRANRLAGDVQATSWRRVPYCTVSLTKPNAPEQVSQAH